MSEDNTKPKRGRPKGAIYPRRDVPEAKNFPHLRTLAVGESVTVPFSLYARYMNQRFVLQRNHGQKWTTKSDMPYRLMRGEDVTYTFTRLA